MVSTCCAADTGKVCQDIIISLDCWHIAIMAYNGLYSVFFGSSIGIH